MNLISLSAEQILGLTNAGFPYTDSQIERFLDIFYNTKGKIVSS